MTDVKNILQSKTIWGSIMVLASTGATMMGYDIGDTDELVNGILALTGAGLAIYGRITAIKKVTVL